MCIQKKQYIAYSEIGHFLCSVISQGKVVAIDRWSGKWNHLSMTHRLTMNCVKNYCNRTLIVKVIIENVVTCFLGTQCSMPILWSIIANCQTVKQLYNHSVIKPLTSSRLMTHNKDNMAGKYWNKFPDQYTDLSQESNWLFLPPSRTHFKHWKKTNPQFFSVIHMKHDKMIDEILHAMPSTNVLSW